MRILIRVRSYYNDSGLVFSHKMCDEKTDLTLVESKNPLKFILSKSSRARKLADRARGPTYANRCSNL
jgi:hypothetical protein